MALNRFEICDMEYFSSIRLDSKTYRETVVEQSINGVTQLFIYHTLELKKVELEVIQKTFIRLGDKLLKDDQNNDIVFRNYFKALERIEAIVKTAFKETKQKNSEGVSRIVLSKQLVNIKEKLGKETNQKLNSYLESSLSFFQDAVLSGNVSFVKYLLNTVESSHFFHLEDNTLSPLQWAVLRVDLKMIRLLLSRMHQIPNAQEILEEAAFTAYLLASSKRRDYLETCKENSQGDKEILKLLDNIEEAYLAEDYFTCFEEIVSHPETRIPWEKKYKREEFSQLLIQNEDYKISHLIFTKPNILTPSSKSSFIQMTKESLMRKDGLFLTQISNIPGSESLDVLSPLHWKVLSGDFSGVRKLANQETIDLQGYHGISPLHLACLKRDIKMVYCLLSYQAKADLKDSNGQIPLFYGLKQNFHSTSFYEKHAICFTPGTVGDLIRCFLNEYPFLIRFTDENKKTIFHKICSHIHTEEDVETVKKMIDLGIDINAQDALGKTGLHYLLRASTSVKNGSAPSVKHQCAYTLFKAKANLSIKDNFQVSIFDVIIESGDSLLVQYLIESYEDFPFRDAQGNTILHRLARMRNRITPVLMEVLEKKEINWNVFNYSGVSPLFYAHRRNKIQLVDMIIDKGGINFLNRANYLYWSQGELLPIFGVLKIMSSSMTSLLIYYGVMKSFILT